MKYDMNKQLNDIDPAILLIESCKNEYDYLGVDDSKYNNYINLLLHNNELCDNINQDIANVLTDIFKKYNIDLTTDVYIIDSNDIYETILVNNITNINTLYKRFKSYLSLNELNDLLLKLVNENKIKIYNKKIKVIK